MKLNTNLAHQTLAVEEEVLKFLTNVKVQMEKQISIKSVALNKD